MTRLKYAHLAATDSERYRVCTLALISGALLARTPVIPVASQNITPEAWWSFFVLPSLFLGGGEYDPSCHRQLRSLLSYQAWHDMVRCVPCTRLREAAGEVLGTAALAG